jgi:hypothetical protein
MSQAAIPILLSGSLGVIAAPICRIPRIILTSATAGRNAPLVAQAGNCPSPRRPVRCATAYDIRSVDTEKPRFLETIPARARDRVPKLF